MGKFSRKHHYIPQFYLKGFCSTNKTFSVYDKEYDSFRNQPQSPASNFFEKYRNTIKINGIRTDEIEKLYSNFDTQFSQLFDLIQSGESHQKIITKDGLYLLKIFLAIQFWRLPITDSLAKSYIQNFNLEKLGKAITFNDVPIGEVEEIKSSFKNDADFQYYFKCFFLPIITFNIHSKKHDIQNWRIFDVEDESRWAKHICGDNPIIVDQLDNFMSFNGSLIFPLTKSRILIRSSSNKKLTELSASFSSMLSLLVFAQSQKYICGPDRQYILDIKDTYKRIIGKLRLKDLNKEVISYIN